MNLNTLLDLAIMIFAGMFCGRMATANGRWRRCAPL